MAFSESEKLKLKIQDDDEFLSIVPTAENFQKIDAAFGNAQTDFENFKKQEAAAQASLSAEISKKASNTHKHTADEISETTQKKIMIAAERTKLSGIATGATKNVVDSVLNKNSTNCISNSAAATAIDEVAENLKNHEHTADEISETTQKKIMTAAERTKLSGIATGATKNVVDGELKSDSSNAVANNVVSKKFDDVDKTLLTNSACAAATYLHLSSQGAFKSTGGNGGSGLFAIGDVLVVWGTAKKANLQDNVVETVSVSFPNGVKFADGNYLAFATALTAVPNKISVGCTSRAQTGFTINHFRTNMNETTIGWVAIGKNAVNETDSQFEQWIELTK